MIVGRCCRVVAPLTMPCVASTPPCRPHKRGVGLEPLPPKRLVPAPKAPPAPDPWPPKQHGGRASKPLPSRSCTAAHELDRAIETGLHLAPWVPGLPQVALALAEQRRKVVRELAEKLAPAVAQLAPQIEAHDPQAIRDYDTLMDAAVQALRHAKDGSWRCLLVDLDNLTYHHATELSDDPSMPMPARVAILDTLHRFNVATFSYQRWGDELLPWLQKPKPGDAPISIVDLAAGTGGFAVALKQRFGSKVQVTATDLVDDFLQLGAAQARRTGTDVAFAHQDVLDLRPLRGQGIDVLTCTQSLHHFTPGQLGRMVGEALACTQRGLCFVDGERGMLVTALVTLSMALYGRDYPVVHDTFVSLRRMYVAEELELLARLAPFVGPQHVIDAGRLAPGHLVLRVSQPAPNLHAKGKLP